MIVTMIEEADLDRSSRRIVEYIDRVNNSNHAPTQTEIVRETNLPVKVVKYKLRRLYEKGLIEKVPKLLDMRTIGYAIAGRGFVNGR